MRFPRRINPILAGAAGVALIGALGLVWARGDRILGNDGFGYLELAKQFRENPPTHFGDWWPFGFPLLGAALSRVGLSSYASLVIVSALAFGAIVSAFWWGLPEGSKSPLAVLVVAGACCAPVCPLLLAMVLSEPLFSAFLFGLGLALSRWPSPGAIVLSMLLALGAFGVRYVGAYALGLLPLWALLRWPVLAKAKRLLFFGVLYTLTLSAAGFLCYLNYRHHGRMAGPQPLGHEHFSSWPLHLADFGWSPVGAFVSTGVLRAFGGISNPIAIALGVGVVGLIAIFLFRVWRTPACIASVPMVLIIVGYSLGIVTLRATTPFDGVSAGRTFLPVLFPLAYLVVADISQRSARAVKWGAAFLLAIALFLAGRGISGEVNPDVTEARSALANVLKPGDTVAVNGDARPLAAYFENRFQPIMTERGGLIFHWEPTELWDARATNFTVVGRGEKQKDPEVADRKAAQRETLISRAVASGQAQILARGGNFVLLERTAPAQ